MPVINYAIVFHDLDSSTGEQDPLPDAKQSVHGLGVSGLFVL